MMVLFNTELISKIVILFFLRVNKCKGNTALSVGVNGVSFGFVLFCELGHSLFLKLVLLRFY